MRFKSTQASNATSVRPGTLALKQIRKFKRQQQLLVPRSTFARVLREVSASIPCFRNYGLRWSFEGAEAIQAAAEHYLSGLFEDSNFCAEHAARQTLYLKDMQLARRIRGRYEVLTHIIHLS